MNTLESFLEAHNSPRANTLLRLLRDPHPGLSSWNEACSSNAKLILGFEDPHPTLARMLRNGGAP